jgi:hypothetical protein
MKNSIKYLLLLILPALAQGQVYLTGTGSNTVIKSYNADHPEQSPLKSVHKTFESIYLPFKDDFLYDGVYPDLTKWINKDAFINGEYPVFPVDRGVATLDVLDSLGDFYPNAATFPFLADHLTSYPIRLDSVFDSNHTPLWKTTPADSVYFSFYYQPQGRGDAPLTNDSLVLQFGYNTSVFSYVDSVQVYGYDYLDNPDSLLLPASILLPPVQCNSSLLYTLTDTLFYNDSITIPCDSVFSLKSEWKNIWSTTGQTLDSFMIFNNNFFQRKWILITDSVWFRSDFQFRFFNYGSLSNINSWKSNTDHWNIDKVYLDYGRSINDFYSREIRFVQPASSLLDGYTSIPMWQFNEDMTADTIIVYANNPDSVSHSCTYNYTVQDETGNLLPNFNYPGYTGILEPLFPIDVLNYKPFAELNVNSQFEYAETDEISYLVTHVITDDEDTTIGDTIHYMQRFSNYYAYDDGSAERGYGASSANTKIAVKFRTLFADTLRGVQIYFNRTLGDYNLKNFNVWVWNDNNGIPGSRIDTLKNKLPDFQGVNEFSTYLFSDTLIRLGVDVIYVGVEQTTNDNLNIGFDKNTNAQDKTFYNTNGQWLMSPFEGSLMIRPLFGKSLSDSVQTQKSLPAELSVYPNPAANVDFVTLVLPRGLTNPNNKKYLTLRVFDLYGKSILSVPFSEYLKISWLRPGFYIIDIFDEAYTRHYTTKMLINRN